MTEPGAAHERTVLAWWRTALAATIVTVLFARLAWARGAVGASALAVPGWLLVLAVTRQRIRALGRGDPPARPTPPLLALVVVSTAVFGMALAVLP
jgi:uncharacterized membrane protein YidH (DUF202 family)